MERPPKARRLAAVNESPADKTGSIEPGVGACADAGKWQNLTNVLVCHTLVMLDADQRALAGRVCRSWSRASTDGATWCDADVHTAAFRRALERVPGFARRLRSVRSLYTWTPPRVDHTQRIGPPVHLAGIAATLHTLHLASCVILPDALLQLPASIRTLFIHDCVCQLPGNGRQPDMYDLFRPDLPRHGPTFPAFAGTLTSLHVGSQYGTEQLVFSGHLAGYSQLTSLSLGNITNINLAGILRNAPLVSTLCVRMCELGMEQFEAVGRQTALTTLTLDSVWPGAICLRTALGHLAALPNLRVFAIAEFLRNVLIPLNVIARFPELRHLYLHQRHTFHEETNRRISDTDLDVFRTFPKLETLETTRFMTRIKAVAGLAIRFHDCYQNLNSPADVASHIRQGKTPGRFCTCTC